MNSKANIKQVTAPKITIITPVLNQVDYIEETIQSVLYQNYSNLEYIIIDGGSTDGTMNIIKKYSSQLTYQTSEPDRGMYDALNKGFSQSTGELMGWINAGDILMPNCLPNLARVFSDVPQLRWLQGLSTFMDIDGNTVISRVGMQFSLMKFLKGQYEWIQQESTFWHRSLWEDAGARIDHTLKLAGDFELWFRFSQHATLYNIELPLGAWRIMPGQLSEDKQKYHEEVQHVLTSFIAPPSISKQLNKLNYYERLIQWCNRLRLQIPKWLKRRHMRTIGENVSGIYYVFESNSFTIQKHAPGYWK